ncbi:MAG: dephospho-CoA kinase [Mangrovicoccus sp.]|nr:dephospho-CoA kinase [Mangrovicoccus sp.]
MSAPYVIGLTGSIGMGKSTTAKMFTDAGCALWDADAAVHRLYAPGGAAVAPMGALYPAAIVDEGVSREALKTWITEDASALRQIEAVVHPLVAADRAAFLQQGDSDIVVLDIPLLFEGGMERFMDMVVVVSAPPEVQRERVLARPGMSPAQFETILAKQMPDAEKRRRADRVIETIDIDSARKSVEDIVVEIRQTHA